MIGPGGYYCCYWHCYCYCCRRLLQAGILLDSAFLDRSKGRTTDLDEEMAALLGGGEGGLGAEAQQLYEELHTRRNDVSRMPTKDLLRKDYKQWAMGSGDALSQVRLTPC